MRGLLYLAELLLETDGVVSVELEGEAPERLRAEFVSAARCTEVSDALELVISGYSVHQVGPSTLIVHDEE
jgi:hypothetical protein